MNRIIAIRDGEKIIFENKRKAMKFFEITWKVCDKTIKNGLPITAPGTNKEYFLDDLAEKEDEKCEEENEYTDWEDWD